MPKKRKKIDWEAIEREYRAGQLSNCEIARQYGCAESSIRKKAKQLNWEKNLSKKVRERVREKIVREKVRNSSARDEDIIEGAANRAFKVIRSHRRDAQQQRGILGKLNRIIDGRVPAKDPGKDELKFQEIKDVSIIQRNAAQALDKLVNIERRAFNIDATAGDEDAPDSITIQYQKKK